MCTFAYCSNAWVPNQSRINSTVTAVLKCSWLGTCSGGGTGTDPQPPMFTVSSCKMMSFSGTPQSRPCWWVMVQHPSGPREWTELWVNQTWCFLSSHLCTEHVSPLTCTLVFICSVTSLWPLSCWLLAQWGTGYLSHTLIGLLSVYWSKQVAAHLPRSPAEVHKDPFTISTFLEAACV